MHPYHEILYYIDGDATFICEAFRKKLTPKTLLIIPREHFHYFQIDSPQRFERLKISFLGIDGFDSLITPLIGGVKLYDSLDGICNSVLTELCDSLLNGDDDDRTRAMAIGTLLILLSRLDGYNYNVSSNVDNAVDSYTEDMILRILGYIDANLTSDISTECVAKQMNISPSTLSHIFKKHLGVSLHQFVIQKRLITAQRLISDGQNPTTVYIDCGYGDYSSFYKAYVKMFGSPPSAAKKERTDRYR
jgi:AraC-like DNA-binding protein